MGRKKPKLVIWGASGHAKVIADIIQLQDHFQIIGFLDDVNIDRHGETFFGYPILGGKEQLEDLIASGTEHMILGFGDCHLRYELAQYASSKGFRFPCAIHPKSIIARDVSVGEGTVVVAGAIANPGATIGKHVIINTCASVGHDCSVDNAAHISGGVRLGGHCIIGRRSFVGIGAVLLNRVKIGKDCVIGAGAVVLNDLPDNVLAYGVPAKIVKRIGKRLEGATIEG